METLRLKPRQPTDDVVDNWDDDDFMIEGDDFTVHSHSASVVGSHRRDSHSSLRSDFESVHGEEEKHVHLPGDDEKSTLDAIAAAAKAGIPLPTNVPPSALMGGTIKRLGGRKLKKIIQEDWGDDLEFPAPGQSLQIKQQDGSKFPEVLRQVSSSTHPSPSKPAKLPATIPEVLASKPMVLKAPINLDRFRETEEDEDFFGDGAATIKVVKKRDMPKPISLITPPTPQKTDGKDDDFEHDFELPSDGKLKLSNRRDIPKTPSSGALEDLEWAEGSLGTRFGGTRREGRSNRSSSVSALSPSITSSVTAESEDEALDGLVLPEGPVNFGDRLKRRRVSRSPERIPEETIRPVKAPPAIPEVITQALPQAIPQTIPQARPQTMNQAETDGDDFLDGLDFGEGDVFGSRKPNLHRNVQLKETRAASPSRPKATVALKFTTKPMATSRLPRPMGSMGPMISHERTHTQSSLEPVSESGGPISHTRRSLSRLGHSAQSSVTSLPTPTTPSSTQSMLPATPRRREVGQKTSTTSLRNEPTTTSAQLLRLKRSLPAMKPPQSPARPITTKGYERPPSRTEMTGRPQSSMRPKTPVERFRTVESSASQARKPPPFLPGGSSASQSHNVNARGVRTLRRYDSDNNIDFRPHSRAVSRSTMRSPSPRKHRQVEKIALEGPWQQVNKPRRVRHFGDGHELDGFDDLPTSTQAEAKFLRQPIGAGNKTQLRNRLYQNVLPDRTNTPSPITPYSPARTDQVPSFARDTAASRIARETSLAQRTLGSGPAAPLTAQRVAQLSTRANYNPSLPPPTLRSAKKPRKVQLKPHLIANLNPPKESKMVNGMFYNPETFRWEGNDHALNAFDVPASSPSTTSVPAFIPRERESSTPRPALITNIGATKGVQVVGGMVFDPQNMCWLKYNPQTGKATQDDPMDDFDALEDDDDVFKDIPDLEDHTNNSSEAGHGRVSDVKDDWLVGEEFDVGPAFVRRQREEEERWRKKCLHWFTGQQERGDEWKWRIHEIVNQSVQN